MKVTIEVSGAAISQLVTVAMSSNDPVTKSWLHEINGKSPRTRGWYARPETFDGPFEFEVIESDEDNEGRRRLVTHKINEKVVAKGLGIMATKYTRVFKYLMRDQIDQPTADIF